MVTSAHSFEKRKREREKRKREKREIKIDRERERLGNRERERKSVETVSWRGDIVVAFLLGLGKVKFNLNRP